MKTLGELLSQLRRSLAPPPATEERPARTFVVNADVRLVRGGDRHISEIDFGRFGWFGGETRYEVLAAPTTLSVGEVVRVRLALEATKSFGPGWLDRGDRMGLGGPRGEYIGEMTVRDVVPFGADPDDAESQRRVWRSTMDAQPRPDGTTLCPACGFEFTVDDRMEWTGLRHSACGQKLNLVGVENQVKPVWCLVGNIVEERRAGPGGEQSWRGTKHFSPGTKVYCYPPMWGDGGERLQVLGRPRHSQRFIQVIIKFAWVTNRRAKLVYSPTLVDRLGAYWDGSPRSRELAEALVGLQNTDA